MNFIQKKIGNLLIEKLNQGYDIKKISDWTTDLFTELEPDCPLEVSNVLRRLFLMDIAPKFEYTEQELRLLAELLIYGEENTIKFIDDLKSIDSNKTSIILEISKNQLNILYNTLNLVCQEIELWEFQIRIGVEIDQVKMILESLNSIYKQADEIK